MRLKLFWLKLSLCHDKLFYMSEINFSLVNFN